MKKRQFTASFKFKVVLESLKEIHSLNEIAQKYELSPSQISGWKKSFLEQGASIFEGKQKKQKSDTELEKERLLQTIGALKVENDYLKKVLK